MLLGWHYSDHYANAAGAELGPGFGEGADVDEPMAEAGGSAVR
jgi:hypothetical protein